MCFVDLGMNLEVLARQQARSKAAQMHNCGIGEVGIANLRGSDWALQHQTPALQLLQACMDFKSTAEGSWESA